MSELTFAVENANLSRKESLFANLQIFLAPGLIEEGQR